MSVELKELLYLAGHDKDNEALQNIIERFKPVIEKSAKILDYDGADTDLIINLIEMIRKIDFSKKKFYNDGQVVNYISKSIRNKGKDIYRRNKRNLEEIHIVSLYEIKEEPQDGYDRFFELTDLLNERQRKVVHMRYYGGFSDVEIDKSLGISRQAVNKIHRKALDVLRQEVGGEDYEH